MFTCNDHAVIIGYAIIHGILMADGICPLSISSLGSRTSISCTSLASISLCSSTVPTSVEN